jgi:hypothetical protein
MFSDLMKHHSIIQINRQFIKLIREKFNNKINVAQYIIERLIFEDIRIAYSHKIINLDNNLYTDNYLFKIAKRHKTFELIYNKSALVMGQKALTYAKIFRNSGVIFGPYARFDKLSVPLYHGFSYGYPIVLITLYDRIEPVKIMPIDYFIKDAHSVNESVRFPHLLEYMIVLSKLPRPGPVHLNILNDVLTDPVNLDDIGHYPVNN